MSSRPGSGTKLSTRLIVLYSLIFLALIGLMAVAVDRVARESLIDDIEDDLAIAGGLAFESLPSDIGDYQKWAEESFRLSGYRTTLIHADGVVLADSHTDPAAMENHSDREEVQGALAGHIGIGRRVSASTGFDQLYVALPPGDNLIVRTSVPTRVINNDINAIRLAIVITGVAVGALGVLAVAFFARRMARPITELTKQASAVADGDLEVETRRSVVEEFDQLGLAISAMAKRLGSRVSDAEQASATLEVVLGALPQGTVLVASDDVVVYSNRAAASMLGHIPGTVIGIAPHQLQTAVREARESKKPAMVDVEHGSPVRNLRGVATPFLDDGRVLLLIIDVTERERADAIRRDFVANASHELKTPVATIIASAEAMQIAAGRGDASATGFAQQVESSARQLDSLVSDLLDLSRLERERPELSPVRIDLLVGDEVERVRQTVEEKGLSIHVVAPDITANVSHRDMAIAVRNLLDNAVRYTSDDGEVSVVVTGEDGQFVIAVSDTGDGIPTRDLGRVFERFYRVDSARARATGGTGLGLSIVKHVAESHQGSVAVDSELGVGSTFTLTVPLGLDGEDPYGN